jgi:hypothetical protein
MHSFFSNFSLFLYAIAKVALNCGIVFAVFIFYVARKWAKAHPEQPSDDLVVNLPTADRAWLKTEEIRKVWRRA